MRTRKNVRHFLWQEKKLIVNMVLRQTLAKEVVERSYPTDDVATLRHFKKKVWTTL
jgi:hypothetical protein